MSALFALAALALPPASAQEITAEALTPEAGWPLGEDVIAISESDLVMLLPPSDTRPHYLVERRGVDLTPIWSEELELPEPPAGGLYSPDADRSNWVSLHANDEVVWVFYMDGLMLKARAVDPATGAASAEREVARVGEERATRERFASTTLSGSHPHPGAIPFAASPGGRYFVVGVTEVDGSQEIRVLDADLKLVNRYGFDEWALTQVRLQVDDQGTLLMSGLEKNSTQLILIRVPEDGSFSAAFVELGDRRVVRDLRLVSGPEGAVYGAALTGTPGNRIDGLHVFGVRGSEVLFAHLLDDEALKAQLTSGLLGGLSFHGLDAFVRLTQAELDPSGNLLIGWRSMFAEEGKDVTTELNRFSAGGRNKTVYQGLDTTLMSYSPEGELRWATTAPTATNVQIPFELATPSVFTDDSLRLVYRSLDGKQPSLSVLDIQLDDGALGKPAPFVPSFSAGQAFLAPLAVGGAGSQWVVATRVPGDRKVEDRTLLHRVDLSLDAPSFATPAPGGASGPEFQVGQAAGYAAGYNRPRRDQWRGIGWGVASGLVGTAAGLKIAGDNSAQAGVLTLGLFYAGGAVAAGRLGGAPGEDWWTTRSPEYQAGYIDGYEEVSRKRARRWALISGAATSLVVIAAQ
jgi:hypothetical protein